MKNLKHILLLSFFILGCNFLVSAKTIIDVFENKSYEVNVYYKEITLNESFIKNKLDINYLSFKNPETEVQKKFNDRSLDWVKTYINSEKRYYNLLADIKQKMEVYNQLAASKNSYDYGYEETLNMNSVRLTDVDCNPLSVVDQKLFFELEFVFEFGGSSRGYNSSNTSIKTAKSFTIDLKTGAIKPFEISLSNERKSELMDELSTIFKEQYLLITSQLDFEELTDVKNLKKNFIDCENICEVINLDDADIYWYGWGVMISFRSVTPSSKIYYGHGFKIFLPLSDNRELIQSFKPFEFAKHLKTPSVNISDFEALTYNKKHTVSTRREPDINDLFRINNIAKTPSFLRSRNFQIHSDTVKRFLSKKEYRFNKSGQIINEKSLDKEDNTHYTLKKEYRENGTLELESRTKSSEDKDSHYYYYDDNKNNIKTLYLSQETYRERYFFYNGNNVYQFDNKMFSTYNSDLNIDKLFVSDDKYCVNNGCYLYDDNRKLIGFSAKKRYSNIQIGYDEHGRISDIYSDNDRYLTLYKYDTLNRLISFEVYEGATLNHKSIYEYESEKLLPLSKTTTNRSSVLEEKYEWY